MRTRRQGDLDDVEDDEDETRSGVNQNQLCFVHIFLIFDTLYNCYQNEDFLQGCDEEMHKPQLVLTLLKIIS